MDERAADVTYGVSKRTDTRLLLLFQVFKHHPSSAGGGLELKLAVVPVRPLKLRASGGEHRSQDPAACTDGQLVDNIVSEHHPKLLTCRRCLLDRPHTQPNCCESAGQQGGNR